MYSLTSIVLVVSLMYYTFTVSKVIVMCITLHIILTAADVFPNDPDEIGFRARSDVRIDALKQATWFFVPYPGKTMGLFLYHDKIMIKPCKKNNKIALIP